MKKILPLLILTVFLTACTGQSIDTGAHPLSIGIDYSHDSALFTESGLFCLYNGDKVQYTVIKTDGVTVAQAMEKKTGYSYRSFNYALLSAIALGQGALQKGMNQALFPLFKWASLPSEDILVCLADTASEIIDSQELPDLLKNASSEGFLPKASLKDCMVSVYEGSPLLLPHVIKRSDGMYICGSTVVENGVMTAIYDRPQTVLWGLLFYPEGSGAVTAGNISVQCRSKRTVNRKSNSIKIELAVRMLSNGDPEKFRQSIENDLSAFVKNMGCDIIQCGLKEPFKDIKVNVTLKPY